MTPKQLQPLYWIISFFFTISVFILVIYWEKKSKREKEWEARNRRNEKKRELDRLLEYDENSYS